MNGRSIILFRGNVRVQSNMSVKKKNATKNVELDKLTAFVTSTADSVKKILHNAREIVFLPTQITK